MEGIRRRKMLMKNRKMIEVIRPVNGYVALMVLAISFILPSQVLADDNLVIGEEAPQFILSSVNPSKCGLLGRFSLNNFKFMEEEVRPKAYVITFFATWCEPCKKELRFLQDLYTKYKDRGLMVVNISIDKDDDSYSTLVELVNQYDLTFPVLWDPYAVTGKRYKVPNTLPYEVILDADGRVVRVLIGPKQSEIQSIQQNLIKLLKVSARDAVAEKPLDSVVQKTEIKSPASKQIQGNNTLQESTGSLPTPIGEGGGDR